MKIQLEQKLDLKTCSICGSNPLLSIDDMGKSNGRGYPGEFMYYFYCPFCQKLEGNSFTTVYVKSKKECIEKAAESWNEEVDKIKTFLAKEEESEKMKSKKLLNLIVNEGHIIPIDDLLEIGNQIEKDLDALEILKKYVQLDYEPVDDVYRINNQVCNEKEYCKIKEWLEK